MRSIGKPEVLAPAAEDKTKIEAKETSIYGGNLGEAWPDPVKRLPDPLEGMIQGYLANHVDTDPKRYTSDHLARFTLFDKRIAANQRIATLILAGNGKEAFDWILKNLSSLESFTEAYDPFGRLVGGTPLRLAVAMRMDDLAQEIKRLLSKEKIAAQLEAQFPSGWENEMKIRMDRYRNAIKDFKKQLIKNRLPLPTKLEEADIKHKDIIHNYRKSLRPKPNDPAITTGFIIDPQLYLDVIKIIGTNERDFGGSYFNVAEYYLLQGVGLQSLLGAGTATMAQNVIAGIRDYCDQRKWWSPTLTFSGGTPFYSDNIDQGLGARSSFLASDNGYLLREVDYGRIICFSHAFIRSYYRAIKPTAKNLSHLRAGNN
ncbi:MAG: hypothetical protein ACYCQI_13415 [Gammaproteobacteria bacterium]